MAKNYFKRYIWLIDLLNRRGPISTQQIKEAWLHSPLNPQCRELSDRTFFNHKDAILDLFGIHIVNDRALGFSIKDFNMGDDAMENWMLHLLCLNNILQENSDMKDRILVDNVPSSERFLTEVISAMRNSKVIHLYYKSFRSQVTSDFDVEPYCVKHFKQRWYMLGKSPLGLRVYSLDRFVDMEEIQEEFDLPANFDAEIFFSDYFGVIVGEEPESIKIAVSPDQTDYFRTLPLHSSQKEQPQEDGSSIFSYHLAPTYDFVQELLSHGSDIEVLSPPDLRGQIARISAELNSMYNG